MAGQMTFPIAGREGRNGAARPAAPVSLALPASPAAPTVETPAPPTPPAGPTPPAPEAGRPQLGKAPAPKAAAKKEPAARRAPAKKPTAPAPRPTATKPAYRSAEDVVFAVTGYAVAVTAVVVSYSHTYEVADMAGQGWRSILLPVSVDALALVSVMAERRCRRLELSPDRLVTGALVLSVVASLSANVVAADPTVVDRTVLRWVVGAWSPLAFLLAELVIKQWHRAGAGVHTARSGASPSPSKPKETARRG